MLQLSPGDIYYNRFLSDDSIHSIVCCLKSETIEPTLQAPIYLLLYNATHMRSAGSLMYHQHNKRVRAKVIEKIMECRVTQRHLPISVLDDISLSFSTDGKSFKRKKCILYHGDPRKYVYPEYTRVKTIHEFEAILDELRKAENISNRHHRKLKEFNVFLTLGFTPAMPFHSAL